MRITLLIPSLQAGGAERVLSIMAHYWMARGDEITIISLDAPTVAPFYALDSRLMHKQLNLLKPSQGISQAIVHNIRRLFSIRSAIRISRPHVVISLTDKMNVLVLMATVGLPIPILVAEHNDPSQVQIKKIWSVLRSVMYRRAASIVVLTSNVVSFFGMDIYNRIRVIPNPIALDPHSVPVIRSSHNSGINMLIAVGRLEKQKGFDLLLSAFSRAVAEHPNWHLTIWGEGNCRAELVALKRKLGLDEQVHLPGITKEVFAEMSRADLFVLSSRYEGFPMVLCEAMACGLPVVSFDCPSGPRDIIRDGIDGFLVPPGDEAGLAAALSRLMGDAAERARLALRAPDVLERFGLEQVMAQWDGLLAEVLPAAAGQRAPDLQRESLR